MYEFEYVYKLSMYEFEDMYYTDYVYELSINFNISMYLSVFEFLV